MNTEIKTLADLEKFIKSLPRELREKPLVLWNAESLEWDKLWGIHILNEADLDDADEMESDSYTSMLSEGMPVLIQYNPETFNHS